MFATSGSRGGTIIDSGTTLAYLAEEAYDPFVEAVSSNLKRAILSFTFNLKNYEEKCCVSADYTVCFTICPASYIEGESMLSSYLEVFFVAYNSYNKKNLFCSNIGILIVFQYTRHISYSKLELCWWCFNGFKTPGLFTTAKFRGKLYIDI